MTLKLQKTYKVNTREYQCAFHATVSVLASKWKMCIVLTLLNGKIVRYGELKRQTKNISDKMLIQSLRELESDGIILRKEYAAVPPKVEYSLTEIGLDLKKVLDSMDKFGENFAVEIE